jgi:hypothetical protein
MGLVRVVAVWHAIGAAGMTRPPAQAFDEAAASWRASGGFEAAFSAAARSVAARRECDLPRYALTAWAAAHGGVLPDHPCVFVAEPATTAAPAFREFRDRGAFLDRYGQVAVHAEPGYTQAGGHLGYFKCAPSRIGCSVKLADLAASWQPNGTRAGLYVSEFSEGPLTDAAWDALRSLAYFSADLASRNFLVGGDRSGLPFHKHAKTWQMLFAGRKVWYLLPPGAWPRALADLVGPYLFPADAWADAVDALPNVAGLLRCEQLPGEILYFPDDWWHATLNDADYSVAYGEKPHRMPVVDGPSPALAAMLGRAANAGRGDRDPPLGDWYNVLPRSRHRGGQNGADERVDRRARARRGPAAGLAAPRGDRRHRVLHLRQVRQERGPRRSRRGGEHRAAPRPRHLEPPVRASIAKAAVYQRQTYPPSLACKIALYFSTTEW